MFASPDVVDSYLTTVNSLYAITQTKAPGIIIYLSQMV